MFRPLLLSAALLLCGCTHTLYTVGPQANTAESNAIVYTLPKTVLTVRIEVEETTKEPGPYTHLHEVLGLSVPVEIPAKKTTTYQIKSTTASARATPDDTARFTITPEERGLLVDQNISFKFTEQGMLTNADASFEDHRAGFATNVVTQLAKVASTAMGVTAAGEVSDAAPTPSAFVPKAGTSDSESSTMATCIDAVEKKLTKDGETDAEKNEAVAKTVCGAQFRLARLVARRDEMITATKGHVPQATFAAQLAATNKEIEALEALFYPTVKTSVRVHSFEVEPSANVTEVCVALDPNTGTINDSSKCTDDANTLLVAVPKGPPATCKAEGGLVYRTPVTRPYSITHDGKQAVLGEATFPQLGHCASAPNTIRGRKGNIVVELSKSSGMLSSITLHSESDYSKTIDALGESIDDVVSAAKAKKDAEDAKAQEDAASAAADNDPINLKKRELELLELNRQIACYENTGEPCPSQDTDEEDAQ